MVLLIRHSKQGSVVYEHDLKYNSNKSPLKIIDELCETSFFNYKTYLSIIRKKINFKQLIPVFISEEIVLSPIQNPSGKNNVWINLKTIKCYFPVGNKVKLIFSNGFEVIIDKKIKFFIKQYFKLKVIKKVFLK